MQVFVQLSGPQGCGKTFLANRLRAIIENDPDVDEAVCVSTHTPLELFKNGEPDMDKDEVLEFKFDAED